MNKKLNEIVEKYRGHTRKPSTLDCLTLIFDYLDDEDMIKIIKGKYTTERGARRSIPKLCGYDSVPDYLSKNGWEQINPLMLTDGCILNCREHSGIIINGCLFGVGMDSTFQFINIDLLKLNNEKETRMFQKKNKEIPWQQ